MKYAFCTILGALAASAVAQNVNGNDPSPTEVAVISETLVDQETIVQQETDVVAETISDRLDVNTETEVGIVVQTTTGIDVDTTVLPESLLTSTAVDTDVNVFTQTDVDSSVVVVNTLEGKLFQFTLSPPMRY